MMKNKQDAQKRIGKQGLDKLAAGAVGKFDITFFALLMLDDPALLSPKVHPRPSDYS